MTTPYPADAPWTFHDAVSEISTIADDRGLPFPRALRDNIAGTFLLVLDFYSHADALAWRDVFGYRDQARGTTTYADGWHGWTVAAWWPLETSPPVQAEVAAAILGPDAPPLPADVDGYPVPARSGRWHDDIDDEPERDARSAADVATARGRS